MAIVNGTFDNDLSGWTITEVSGNADAIWDYGRARLRVYKCSHISLQQTILIDEDQLAFDWLVCADGWWEAPYVRLIIDGIIVYEIYVDIWPFTCRSGTHVINTAPYRGRTAILKFSIVPSSWCHMGDHWNTYYYIDNVRLYAPPPVTGINFSSVPEGAGIIIDGTNTGRVTPYTITDLTPGTHGYTLSLDGYYEYTGSVTVIEGTTANVSATLIPLPGSIYFSSVPEGARIIIDGTNTGRVTPSKITGLALGPHGYTLSLDGYYEYTGSVTVIEGVTIDVIATLIPLPGSIYFSSVPEGAKIFIDEDPTGQVTPATISGIPAGTHTYRLSKWAYYESIGTVDVIANATVSVVATLSPMQTGCQIFNTVPIGSRIFVDGIDFGIYTPVKMCEIPLGTHDYRLEGTFTVPEKGKHCQPFVTVPKDSRLVLDGTYYPLPTPEVVCDIPPGTHAYRLEGRFTVEKAK